jgi:hypothetical protein
MDKKVGLGRNLDDLDYRRYENRIDIIGKVSKENQDEDKQYQYIPERELIDLQKKGFEDNHTELLYENDMLRACIVRLQSELNNFMVHIIDKVRDLDADTKILNHLAFDKYKMIKIDPNVLELPHVINGDKVKKVCVANVEKFKEFLASFLNPTDVYAILAKVNKDLDYESQILTFDDLDIVIKQWKHLSIR